MELDDAISEAAEAHLSLQVAEQTEQAQFIAAFHEEPPDLIQALLSDLTREETLRHPHETGKLVPLT